MVTLYVGLELGDRFLVLAPIAQRRAFGEAGLNISCRGARADPALRHFMLYAHRNDGTSPALPRRSAEATVFRLAARLCSYSRIACKKESYVPSGLLTFTKAAHAGKASSRPLESGRNLLATRVASKPRPRTDEWRQIMIFAALASSSLEACGLTARPTA